MLDLDADGSVAATYLNGLGIDDKLRAIGNSGVSYYLSDQLGSTAGLTDASGNVVQQLDFDSYGNGSVGPRTRYGFTGREGDADTGLAYYRARFYDPELGRFISEDPIKFENGEFNYYVYVSNSPINYSDPHGLYPAYPLFRWYPPIGIWPSAEVGGGLQFIWGLNGNGGVMINPFTGEVCLYTKGCVRYGLGLIGSVGAKGGLAVGPKCGNSMGGWTVEPVAELAFGKGGSGSLAFGESGLGAGKGGPGIGLGFSASIDVCYTKVYCFNSPSECGCK